MSGELDLLRPLSRSLAARAEGKDASEARAEALSGEVAMLRQQLAAVTERAEALGAKAGAVEQESGARESRLTGLEKVVRRLGGEAEVCTNISCVPACLCRFVVFLDEALVYC